MSRFALLAGSVAILAISGVNAGPCRPSSSVISSSVEITSTSTEVSESIATLASTLTTEAQASETLSVTVSTTEDVTTTEASTTAETTAISVDTTTIEATASDAVTTKPTTTEAATTTEAPTTTAETTTALATTSAEPVPEPRHECSDLANPYVAPNGDVYNIACNTDVYSYVPEDESQPGNFEACLSQCSMSSTCSGVEWIKSNSICLTFSSSSGTINDAQYDIAFKVTG